MSFFKKFIQFTQIFFNSSSSKYLNVDTFLEQKQVDISFSSNSSYGNIPHPTVKLVDKYNVVYSNSLSHKKYLTTNQTVMFDNKGFTVYISPTFVNPNLRFKRSMYTLNEADRLNILLCSYKIFSDIKNKNLIFLKDKFFLNFFKDYEFELLN